MEQIDTNKELVTAVTNREVTFWNKPSTRIFILIGIILAGVWYFTEWVPRQECVKKTMYHPAGSGLGIFGNDKSTEGYYTYQGSGTSNFKTQEEAVSHCAQNK